MNFWKYAVHSNVLAMLTALVFTACSESKESTRLHALSGETSSFDVNDVSILWPMPRSSEEYGLLTDLAEEGFLSETNFQTLLGLAEAEDDTDFPFTARKNWHVIAMRFDPCAKSNPGLPDCRHELRLVVQPVVGGAFPACADHALHLIYQLTPAETEEVEQRLWDLKQAHGAMPTNGHPLGVHPTLQSQGLNGTFAIALTGLLAKFAKEESLREATVMLNLGSTQWRFARSLMTPTGQLALAPIPFIDSKMEVLVSEPYGNDGQIQSRISPLATGKDHVNVSVDSVDPEGAFYKMTRHEQAEAIQTALRIDNPERHTAATIDCVSCHMATRVLARVKGKDFLNVEDGSPNRFVPPPGVTVQNETYAESLQDGYETRAFGYAAKGGTFPSITQYTINDSARVAGYLNGKRLEKSF